MHPQEFILRGDYVALCDLLKLTGIADSGGQAKHLVSEGEVTVDGQPETRKTAKIRAMQTVQCHGQTVRVVAAPRVEADDDVVAPGRSSAIS